MTAEVIDQPLDGVGLGERITVQQQEELPSRFLQGDVVGGPKTDVPRLREDLDLGEAGANRGNRSVRGGIINDHNFRGHIPQRAAERVHALDGQFARVVADDHGGYNGIELDHGMIFQPCFTFTS